MAKIKTLLICLVVLEVILVTSNLVAAEHTNKKQNRRKTDALKAKKRPQSDAPLPSKKNCMLFFGFKFLNSPSILYENYLSSFLRLVQNINKHEMNRFSNKKQRICNRTDE